MRLSIKTATVSLHKGDLDRLHRVPDELYLELNYPQMKKIDKSWMNHRISQEVAELERNLLLRSQ